jgi:pyridoxal phosphate enzyme (YggS family)
VATQPPAVDVVARRVGGLRQLIDEVRGDPRAVRIVAVTKTFDVAAWVTARDAGCDAVGENYAQELLDKIERSGGVAALPVHFIGHLQSNKVKALAPHVALWHTVDRASVVATLAKQTDRLGSAPRVLLQVNSTGEGQKSGCLPGDVGQLVALARGEGLVVEGLMTMGPSDADPVATRAAFALTARLAADNGLAELSMGMTDDVRIAIEEGSTIVRVGTGIFGERPRSD